MFISESLWFNLVEGDFRFGHLPDSPLYFKEMYTAVQYPTYMYLGGHIATRPSDLALKVELSYSIAKTLTSQTKLFYHHH